MRFRLLKRRLTISAPSMSIRSNLAWPLRWVLFALMLGFSGAIALWAFEVGKGLTGVSSGEKEEFARLRVEVVRLKEERDKAQTLANTSGGLLNTERATGEKLAQTVKQLEVENRALREDLGFFERLVPSADAQTIAVRGLQAEMLPDGQLRWQALIMQPVKNRSEFKGKLEITVSGLQKGRPWSQTLPEGRLAIEVRQYRRFEGLLSVAAGVQVTAIAAKVLDNSTPPQVKATQSVKL